MQTKVNREFIRIFAELANRYKWSTDDIEEMKEWVRGDVEARKYLEQLGQAHRMGYRQDEGNNWIRLHAWLEQYKPFKQEE